MKITAIANICQNGNKNMVIGYRLMNTDTMEVLDVPTESVKATISKGTVSFSNMALVGANIIGINGALTRYAYIDIQSKALVGAQASPFVVLKKIGDAGYLVADAFGKTAKVRVDKAVEYAKTFGIANGKVVEKDGIEFISSISGNYETEEVKAGTYKNTRGGIAIPMGVNSTTEVAKNAAAGIDYEVNSNDVFKCMSPQQKNLLKSYYMWYTVKVYKQLARSLRLQISPTKVAKLAEIRGNEKWQFAGVWDTGFAGGGHCELGHALRYEFYAEPISDDEQENRVSRRGLGRNNHASILEGGNCIVFGERCAGDFFDILPEDMKKLVKTREIMSQEIEWIVDVITNKREQEMLNRTTLMASILDRLIEIDRVKDIFGHIIGSVLVQFKNANIPFPMSLVLMAAEEFRKNIDTNFDLVFPDRKCTKLILDGSHPKERYTMGYNAADMNKLYEYVKNYQIEGDYMYNPLNESVTKRKDKGGYNDKTRKERKSLMYRIRSGNFGTTGETYEELSSLFTLSEFYAGLLQKVRDLLGEDFANTLTVQEMIKQLTEESEQQSSYRENIAQMNIRKSKQAEEAWSSVYNNRDKMEYALMACIGKYTKPYVNALGSMASAATEAEAEEIKDTIKKFRVAVNMSRFSLYAINGYSSTQWNIPEGNTYSNYRKSEALKEALSHIEDMFNSDSDAAAKFMVDMIKKSISEHENELNENIKSIEEQVKKPETNDESIKSNSEESSNDENTSVDEDELIQLRKVLEENKDKLDTEDYGIKIAMDIAGRNYSSMSDLTPKQQWRVRDTIKKLTVVVVEEEEEEVHIYGITFNKGIALIKDNERVEKMIEVIEKYRNDDKVSKEVNKLTDKAYPIIDTVKRKGYLSPKQMRHIDMAYNKTVESVLL